MKQSGEQIHTPLTGQAAGSRVMTVAAPVKEAVSAPQSNATEFAMTGQCFACITPFQEGSEEIDNDALGRYLEASY